MLHVGRNRHELTVSFGGRSSVWKTEGTNDGMTTLKQTDSLDH